jgi:ATP-dependent Clp protease ATP-binding subunit ClpB
LLLVLFLDISALEKYGHDLVADAESGKLDPVIGRDQEVRRCIQVLSRRTKNNPVLIGEPVRIIFSLN